MRAVIVFFLSLACTPALAQTDFACQPGPSCPQYEGGGRSCSDIALTCQGNCTNGKYTYNSSPQYCSKMCGGAKANCVKTGTWRGVSIITNLRAGLKKKLSDFSQL